MSRAGTGKLSLGDLYAPVAEELRQVDDLIRRELQSEHAYIDELVRYGCMLGGKRLRPALVLLCGKAVGQSTADHVILATVMELVHTASLIHDDVLDDAATRRHLATVNTRWDNKASVLLGDYLFTHAFCLAARLGSIWACQEIGRAVNVVCEGELRQKGTGGDFRLTESVYLDIIAQKTAALYACSCAVGARFAGATQEQVDLLTAYGRDLGIAFQIVDDVLDLAGDEHTVGKSLGTDLDQHKLTLPLIHVLDVAPANERREVLAILQREDDHREKALISFCERFNAFSYSYGVARKYTQSAVGHLDGFRPDPAVDRLRDLADFVLARSA